MAKILGQFSITQESDGYVLHMEDEDGETTEYSASLEQLDLIAEAVDEQLEMEDEDDLVGDDDDEPIDDEE